MNILFQIGQTDRGMPLISVNIKDSGGLASHSNNVTASIERHLNNKSYADLVFIARFTSHLQDLTINT